MWEYLVGVIAEPVQALREVAEKKLWKQGLLLVVALALLNGAVSVAANADASLQDSEIAKLLGALYHPHPAIFLPLVLVAGALSWLINGAVFYGFSKLFKGQGTLAGMLASLGFAASPYLLSIPVSALALLLGQVTGPLVGSVASIVAGIWVLALDVLAIRESQQLNTGQAVGVLLLTFAAFFTLIFIIAFFFAIIAAIIAISAGVGAS